MNNSKRIYCYYIDRDEKVSELLVSYASLLATHPIYKVGCMVGKFVSERAKEFLTEQGLIILDGTSNDYTETIVDEQGNTVSSIICSGKLGIYRFTEYEKIVYLDTDTYILMNIDDVFNYPDGAMTPFSFQEDFKIPNGGLLVCVPNKYISDKIDEIIATGRDKGAFDFYDDQDILMGLNDYLHNPALNLPHIYNVFPFYIHLYRNEPIFTEHTIKMVHFMGGFRLNNWLYKVTDTVDISDFPPLDFKYIMDYLTNYKIIISMYKKKYPNETFLTLPILNKG